MLTVWGRRNSINVIKVLWGLTELGLPCERIDAGMAFGRVNDPDYRALNPNGRVPTLVDGDYVLWESNAILRYLCMRHGGAKGLALYPADPGARASVDRWLDWQLSTLSPAERGLFWGMVRTPPEKRDMAQVRAAMQAAAECWAILEAQLARHGGPYVEGAAFTLADIALGAYARRWFGEEVRIEGMPEFPALRAWYERLGEHEGFRLWLGPRLT
ncbi:glutathione S-transferase family protein [Caldovatus aquaticus]|uniref:Glutathione S-transferase family protein n=1 Tax=Caldovatus aquaticus TaxID=2865671 RepID=A0ABS7F1W9_9PROT|nr:glutathione S-transferase family protein [Caldovatus aquaticus]MBW8268972.1 glutathione S-transferase family protein [Caldovatus aquaticus]